MSLYDISQLSVLIRNHNCQNGTSVICYCDLNPFVVRQNKQIGFFTLNHLLEISAFQSAQIILTIKCVIHILKFFYLHKCNFLANKKILFKIPKHFLKKKSDYFIELKRSATIKLLPPTKIKSLSVAAALAAARAELTSG